MMKQSKIAKAELARCRQRGGCATGSMRRIPWRPRQSSPKAASPRASGPSSNCQPKVSTRHPRQQFTSKLGVKKLPRVNLNIFEALRTPGLNLQRSAGSCPPHATETRRGAGDLEGTLANVKAWNVHSQRWGGAAKGYVQPGRSFCQGRLPALPLSRNLPRRSAV